MPTRLVNSILAAALMIATWGAVVAHAAPSDISVKRYGVSQPIKDRYIVIFKDLAVDPEMEAANIVRSARGELHFTYTAAVRGFAATLPEAAARALMLNPKISSVEQDTTVLVESSQSGAVWGLDRIDQRDLPLNGTFDYPASLPRVYAFIIDTGILNSHIEFIGRIGSGYTAVKDRYGTSDCNGHGTHVAGTVGGSTYGVSKTVTLIPVRVLDCRGSGTNSGVIAGLDFVAKSKLRPAVANMSLGGGASSSLDTAVRNAVTAGVTIVVAAGNSNADACTSSPAREPSAITIAATTTTDSRASYSNFGACVDLFAPGSSVTSAWFTNTTAVQTLSGTSMAAPHVTGVAAQILAQSPTLRPVDVSAAIVANASLNRVVNAGTGSPNRLLFSVRP